MRPAPAPLLVAALVQLAAAGPLRAQADYAANPEGSGTASVAPGERYAAGGLHQAVFGAHYRDLWSTPVQVPVLDLAGFAGGLTPDEKGGGQQTRSLHFISRDGREFTFRSLDKDPTKAVPEPLRGTVVHRLVQDATSAMNPGGALMMPALLEAAGVLHAVPQLVLMPDDERLGPHRATFAGLLGTIEERPDDDFGGAAEIDDTDKLFQRLRESPAYRVDAAAFLTARLVDHLVGDWDRHSDQWRWAGYSTAGGMVYRPIPRDRDQAFARYDGFVPMLARKVNPKLTVFGPAYPPNLAGFTWNARELDRKLLGPLDRRAFDSVAVALQAALTDSVIEAAVAGLPAAHAARWGRRLAEGLRRRRDALPEHARRWYRLLATDVDVWATDAADRAEARWDNGALHLRLWGADGGTPWFDRRFAADETEEVRLFLREGADRVQLAGDRDGPRLQIVLEPGDTVAGLGTAGRVRLHDHQPEATAGPAEPAQPAQPAEDSAAANPLAMGPRDWGADFGLGPRAGHDPDLGLLVGIGAAWTDYAFRREPYGSRTELSAAYATGADGLRAELVTDLRRADPRTRLGLQVRASEVDVVRFNGLGNETPDAGAAGEVDLWRLTVAATLERRLSPVLRVRGGPVVVYATTDRERAAARWQPAPRGAEGFGRIGAAGELAVERAGVRAGVGGAIYPPLWSGGATFGELHGEARGVLRLGGPALVGRIGGKRLWGPFPYDEAAFLGGARTLRGYDYQRFAGDAMLYGGLELRAPIARILPHVIPTRVGVILLGDAGRVWSDGSRSERVHAAAGGGVWLELFEERHSLSVVYAEGREGGRWHLQLGLPY